METVQRRSSQATPVGLPCTFSQYLKPSMSMYSHPMKGLHSGAVVTKRCQRLRIGWISVGQDFELRGAAD